MRDLTGFRTMALFGQRHPRRLRGTRLAVGAPHGSIARAVAALRNRAVLGRVVLCLCAITLLAIAAEAWRTPFPYRVGNRPIHGVQASVDFRRVNRIETDRRRQQAVTRVPLHFRRQELLGESLTNQLRADFQTLAETEFLRELPNEVAQRFALRKPESTGSDNATSGSSNDAAFEKLRDLILARDLGQDGSAAQTRIERVEGLLAEFQQLLLVIGQAGIIDREDVRRLNITPGMRLQLETEGSAISSMVGPGDVELESMMKPGGRIASVWESIPLLGRVRSSIEAWLRSSIEPTLVYDRSETERARRTARDSVDVVFESWYTGQVLVGPGEVIEADDLELLKDEYLAAEEHVPLYQRLIRTATVFLMLIVLGAINGYHLMRHERHVVRSWPRLTVYLLTIVLTVALSRWAAHFQSLHVEVVPVVAAAMIFAVAYSQVMASLTALTVCLILTLSTFGSLNQFVALMSVSVTAINLLSYVPSRSTLIRVGFVTALVYFVVFTGLGVLRSHSIDVVWNDWQIVSDAVKGAALCFGAGFLVAGSLPYVERAFGVVTDISLLEMSDISHPLLQELVRRAPGTYNHSITVASIGESAADAIGANGLLVRVGAYFHDIGKMLKPQYFIENTEGGKTSRHKDLAPAMSTLIIIGHVKDGVDLALEHHLPQSIIDFIEQHHGTTLVQYFYHEALKQAEAEPDHRTDAQESSFRYPGPKPQTREAGVMMLADAVESASRTLSEPTPKRIESLVHKITMDKLLDGQFEESNLTLTEINIVEESLTHSLSAIYHGRIKYPDQRSAG
ncbi:HDIG domain-containing protein [bacterium]|nr:HDIG domain-containing protein [bacterium]